MAKIVLPIGAVTFTFTGQLGWNPNGVIIPGSFTASGSPLYLRNIRIRDSTAVVGTSNKGKIDLYLNPTESGPRTTASGRQDLVAGWETSQRALTFSLAGQDYVFRGPDAVGSTDRDPAEPYLWRPNQVALLGSLITAYNAATTQQQAALTLTLDDGAVPNAAAPTIAITPDISTLAETGTQRFTATPTGGTYDTLTYAWRIVSGGGSLDTSSGNTVLYTPADVSANTPVVIECVATARGTGSNAATGTSDTVTATEGFTVTSVGTPVRVAVTRRHALQSRGDLGITGPRRVAVTLRHATDGRGRLFVGVFVPGQKRLLWNRELLRWGGDLLLWGDERVAATLRHATQGAGAVVERQDRRVAVRLRHATEGRGDAVERQDRPVAATLRHATQGRGSVFVGVEKRVAVTLRHRTQGAGDLGGDKRVAASLRHALQGAGDLIIRGDIRLVSTLRHATEGAGDLFVGVEARVERRLRHATEGAGDVFVGVEKRIQATRQHATEGGGDAVERQDRSFAVRLRHATEGHGIVLVGVEQRLAVRLRHAMQGRGGLQADEIIIGGISLFDERIAGGWPGVADNPTPGVLLAASRGAAGAQRARVVAGDLADRRAATALSRIYTTGPAWVGRLGLSVSGSTARLELALAPTADGTGTAAGPSLTGAALARLGVVISAGGRQTAISLSEVRASDPSEPYEWTRVATVDDIAVAAALQAGGPAQAVIVDRLHNNIAWSLLECGATRERETAGEGSWRVFVDVDEVTAWLERVAVRGTLNNRGEATVALSLRPEASPWPGGAPLSGQDVTIFWDETPAPGHVVRRFAGRVVNPKTILAAAARRLDIQIPAVSYAARLDRLLIREFHRTRPESTIPEAVVNIVSQWAAGEGFETFGVQSSNLAGSHVFDHVPVSDALDAFAGQLGGYWCVDPYKSIVLRATDDAPIYPGETLTAGDFRTVSRKVDEQLLRTAQVVVGGSPQTGQRRQERTGDGVRRQFQLDYRPERVISVSVNGVAQSFSTNEGDPAQWLVDQQAGTITQSPSEAVLGAAAVLDVIYDYNFPIVVARENRTAVGRYGRTWAVEQDSSLDTVEAADELLNRLLTRHDHPTVIMTFAGGLGTRAVGLVEGLRVPLRVPELGIDGETWLCDDVEFRWAGAGVREVDATFQRSSHEALFEAPLKARRRLTTPTQPLEGARIVTAGGGEINPDALTREGLKLPATLAGSPTSVNRNEDWDDIEGAAIAPLDGDNLPSSIVRWAATAAVRGGGVTGYVRLWNRTRGVAVGRVAQVSSTSPVSIAVGRITLSAGLNAYTLQCRKTGGGRFDGVRVWGGTVEVGT